MQNNGYKHGKKIKQVLENPIPVNEAVPHNALYFSKYQEIQELIIVAINVASKTVSAECGFDVSLSAQKIEENAIHFAEAFDFKIVESVVKTKESALDFATNFAISYEIKLWRGLDKAVQNEIHKRNIIKEGK